MAAFTWTHSIKAQFGSGGSLLTGQGADNLHAIITEIRNNLDWCKRRIDFHGISSSSSSSSSSAAA